MFKREFKSTFTTEQSTIRVLKVKAKSGRSMNFKTGGRGPGAAEFLDLKFALIPLHTYPMFLLEE